MLPGNPRADVAKAMALASRAAQSRPGSALWTSAAAARHHGGGPSCGA